MSKRNVIRIKASRKLQYAVFSGKIKKEPCVVCGKNKSEGHHEDYRNPLEVIWLCRSHHKKLHASFGKLRTTLMSMGVMSLNSETLTYVLSS